MTCSGVSSPEIPLTVGDLQKTSTIQIDFRVLIIVQTRYLTVGVMQNGSFPLKMVPSLQPVQCKCVSSCLRCFCPVCDPL